ncbi:hypothetical protein CTI14_71940, partial [Methylobacterium radiotolerans]
AATLLAACLQFAPARAQEPAAMPSTPAELPATLTPPRRDTPRRLPPVRPGPCAGTGRDAVDAG